MGAPATGTAATTTGPPTTAAAPTRWPPWKPSRRPASHGDGGAGDGLAGHAARRFAIACAGYVAEITEQEVFGGYTIQLEADQGWNNVMCATKDKDLALSLDTGQQVMLVGKGNGQVLGSPSLRDCRAFTQN